MDEDERGINMEKIKILAILPSSQELQGGELFTVKLFTSDQRGRDWLYSGIEGHLILIIDSSVKTKYLCLYDPITYQKLFQYELYKNFDQALLDIATDFACFEIDSGFIGFQFEKEEDTEKVKEKVSDIKNKITFMKSIMDYSYPSFLLAKIKIWKQYFRDK